jgi:hypothetical protein
MNLRNMFIANALVSLLFALGLLLMPGTLLDLYGMSANPSEKLLGQFFGVELLAIGLLTLFALGASELRSQRALTLAFFIADGIGFVVALGGMLSGVMSGFGWSTVVIYLLLALGFGYFQFIGPAE